MKVNFKIKSILRQRKITQAQLAAMVGITKVHLNRVINGHQKAIHTKELIAHTLGVKYHDLWKPIIADTEDGLQMQNELAALKEEVALLKREISGG